MKITNNELKKIIKEELNNVMMESQVFFPGKNPNLEMSPREKVDAAMDEIPNAGGSIMGSPGARLKEELLLIADAIDDPEELARLSATVDERAAIDLLSSLGYEDGIDNNRS